MSLLNTAVMVLALCSSEQINTSSEPNSVLLELRLMESIEISTQREMVSAAEVVTVLKDQEQLWPLLSATKIQVGRDGKVSRGTLARRLLAAGLPEYALAISGTPMCTVNRIQK